MKQSKILVNFPLNTLTVAITAAFLSQPLAAQSNVSDINPDDVNTLVVIGQATSGLDNLITEEELDRLQASDLNGIFRNDPTVSVGGPVSMGQKIYVRDLGEDLINISVDGAEQASGVYHHSGRISVEPELLKQVEVEAGAGSATAGPGALGGSIRFTTKDPEDLLEDGKNIGALLKGTYSSNGDYFKKSAAIYARSENNGVSGMINIVNSDKNNIEDGDGSELVGTDSDNKLGFAKLVFNFNEDHKLSLSYENVDDGGDLPYKTEYIVAGVKQTLEPTSRTRKTSILNYSYQPTNNDLVDFSINLYKTNNEETRRSTLYNGTFTGGITTEGATIENTSLTDNHKVIYGINYRRDVSSFESDSYREEGKVWGLYVQDVIKVGDDLTVTTGLRYDHYNLDDAAGLSLSDAGFSPNISANYDLTDSFSISAGYAKALRGPEVVDAYILESSSNDVDLKAETSTNIELGLNYDIENYSFSVGAYQTTIKDYIDTLAPWAKAYTNLEDDLETKGIFARAEYQKENLTLGASIKTSKTEQGGDTVTRYAFSSGAVSTGDTLQLNANYKVSNKLQLGWNMEHVNAINNIVINYGYGDTTADKPAYTVHDIYAEWKPTGKENLKVNFSVNNLFNETYLSHSSSEDFTSNPGYTGITGYNEAGRDVRVTVAYQF